MDRETELKLIEKRVEEKGVIRGPTAFVARTVQVDIPTRKFKHSNVVMKNRYYTFGWRK